MKKLFTLLFIANVFVINSSKAQSLPIAVNDTFYVVFSDTAITYTFNRGTITANDTLGSGTTKIIDTISYNGINQVSVVMSPVPSIRVNQIKFTANPGYFGIDSITYYLKDNGNPTAYDTATIYIYVKRKAFENIDLNNINASIDKEVLFMDRANSVSAFEVPKGDGSHTIFASNFWLMGIDNGGQLKGYAETYASDNPPPSIPFQNYTGNAGPIGVNESYSYQWDRVWKVSAIDIQNHINGNGTTEAITNWPAHGDVALGQAQDLAPFVDVNSDGIYTPTLGDYPKIKGQQAIYFIRNSNRSANQMQTSNNNLEFHGMVYAYDCPEDSAINNTLFLDYTMYNRSSYTLTDCYFGQWVDLDLGNSNDDYVGCDVSRGTFYAYNADIDDEDANGVTGYGATPPFQGVTFLKGAQQDNDGIDNPFTTNISTAIAQNGIPYAGLGTGFGDGILDNEFLGLSHFMSYNIGAVINGNGDPRNGVDIYDYLQGNWLDSVGSVTWGGDGNPLTTGNTIAADYLFPGDSDPLFWSTQGVPVTPVPWTEVEAGNPPGDRRGIGSTGPFTFFPGAIVEMEVAFVFGRDYNGTDNMASLVVMQERVDSIRSYHANGFATTPCGGAILGVKNEAIPSNLLSIYPNPFANQFLVSYQSTNKTTVEVYSLLGQKIVSQPITQHLTLLDLTNQPNGVYFVRVTDGNEVIIKKVVKQ
ncbi:MAG: T9SS type A sorting domain-containing protein [Bacteroidetes bacterium]|nr:T9SS type A sorting domain-containing protein [Bacteroidota bacterium]